MVKPTSRPTVLIADDDPDDRLMMTEAFSERYGECRIRFAQNGVQLMRILHNEEPLDDDKDRPGENPDLILLDLNMPLIDGRKALQEIKGSPGLRQIPTVILTTSDNEDDIRFCYDAGANSYMVKPSSYSNLLDIVSVLKNYWMDTVILPPRPEYHD